MTSNKYGPLFTFLENWPLKMSLFDYSQNGFKSQASFLTYGHIICCE